MPHSTLPDDMAAHDALLTLEELCRRSHVDAAWVTELVDYGVIDARGGNTAEWHFAAVAIITVAKAKRLQRDLSLNPPGIAAVLDLLEQIEDLKAQLRTRGGD